VSPATHSSLALHSSQGRTAHVWHGMTRYSDDVQTFREIWTDTPSAETMKTGHFWGTGCPLTVLLKTFQPAL
ncbi:RIKEN cDNA 4930451E10, partial [Mus musculus]